MFSKPGIRFICTLTVFFAGLVFGQPARGQAAPAANASGGDTSSSHGARDPFIGKWRLNPSRSKISDEMKVAAAGENKYAFDFGAGKSEIVLLDGTDQPAEFDTTLAVSAEGKHAWKVVRKKEGRTILIANWELSPDGKTLTDHFTTVKPDGSRSTTPYTYRRTAGTEGFAGTWESTLEQPAFELEIQPYEGDGLAFINSAQQTTRYVKFDGKDYPAAGPNLPGDFRSSGRRVNDRSMELTEKIGGKSIDTQETELSLDLKTLTMTVHMQSQSKPKVFVFDRE